MRELNDDRGVIAVLTALILSTVLLACAALAVDVAAYYSERRQLQNGADAAAVAIAQSCVRGLESPSAPCDLSTAATLADDNAVDHRARVALVCGTAPGLGTCPAGTTARASCGPVPDGAPPYVEVHTRTGTAGGGDVVEPVFARAIPGNEAYSGAAVGACARAGYGAPTTVVSVLPIVVSSCVVAEYQALHSGFTDSALLDGPASGLQPWETEIELHKDTGPCAGAGTPGNFGYLTSGGGCNATTTVGASIAGSTGNSNPKTLGCSDSYLTAQLGRIVYLPVFDTVTESGSNAVYHIAGYAAFHFTGWQLAGTSHLSIVSGQLPCKKPTTCIAGVFARGLQPAPGRISAAPVDGGATVVALLG